MLDRAERAPAGGIPFGVQAFELGPLAPWPFRAVVASDDPGTFT